MATSADIRALEEEIKKQDQEIESILADLGVHLGSGSEPPWVWICSNCKELNVEGDQPLDKCEVCEAGRLRPQPETPQKAQPQQKAEARVQTEPKESAWRCWACNASNKDSATECAVCYADRSGPTPGPSSSSIRCKACFSDLRDPTATECPVCYADVGETAEPAHSVRPVGSWKCTACTTLNAMDAIECKTCFADRPSAQWPCPACTSLNDDGATQCTVCMADREEGTAAVQPQKTEDEQPLKGWKCYACTTVNPNMVDECTVCFADREFVPPSGATTVLDLSGGKREMLDERRARELLSTASDPLAVKKLIFKTKSFGEGASKVAVEFLRKMSNVEDVDFSDIIAGRPTIEALGVLERMCEALPLNKVKYLDLSDNAIGERGMRVLIKALSGVAKQIERLNFRNNGLSEMAVRLLVDALGAAPRLQGLHFFSNMCGSGGAIALEPLFAKLSKDTAMPFEFTMSSCRVLSDGSLSLVTSLRHVAPRLRFLDLSDTVMGDKAGGELSTTLLQSTSLKTLLLRDCGIKGSAIGSVVESITNLTSLEQLDLSEVPLGKQQTKKLLEGLKRKPCGLRVLHLAGNEAGNAGVAALLQAEHFPHLEVLNLRENELDDEFAAKFINAYGSRSSLKQAELGGNDFSAKTMAALRAAFGDRLGDLEGGDE
jgi:Ran GTPase-activating protein 1